MPSKKQAKRSPNVAILTAGVVAFGFLAYKLFRHKSEQSRALAEQAQTNKSQFGLRHLFDFHHSSEESNLRLQLPPKLVLVTDLDHTLIGKDADETVHQCNQNIQKFNKLWLEKYAPHNCVLVYATGRSYDKFQLAAEDWPILKPDVLICADGVEIYWFNRNIASLVQSRSNYHIDLSFDDHSTTEDFVWQDASWRALLNENWDQNFAESLHFEYVCLYPKNVAPLPRGSLNVEQFRISVLVFTEQQAKEAVEFYQRRIAQYNSQKSEQNRMRYHWFYCVERNSGGWWAAITPENGGKGAALEWLCNRMHVTSEMKDRLIICGDSGNDISMMQDEKQQTVIMGNSSSELKSFYEKNKKIRKEKMILTKQHRTLGVIEGLLHFTEKNRALEG